MRSQDVCMRAIPNYNAQVQEFLFQCKKSIIPNDWQIFRYIYTEEYETSFVKKKYSKDDAHKLSLCISKKIVDAFNKSGCKLINKKSSKSENLFNLDCLSNGSVDINNLEKQFTEECLASFN